MYELENHNWSATFFFGKIDSEIISGNVSKVYKFIAMAARKTTPLQKTRKIMIILNQYRSSREEMVINHKGHLSYIYDIVHMIWLIEFKSFLADASGSFLRTILRCIRFDIFWQIKLFCETPPSMVTSDFDIPVSL